MKQRFLSNQNIMSACEHLHILKEYVRYHHCFYLCLKSSSQVISTEVWEQGARSYPLFSLHMFKEDRNKYFQCSQLLYYCYLDLLRFWCLALDNSVTSLIFKCNCEVAILQVSYKLINTATKANIARTLRKCCTISICMTNLPCSHYQIIGELGYENVLSSLPYHHGHT